MPAIAVSGQRRLGSALAIGVGCVAALAAAAGIAFGQVGADWLRFSLVVQVIVVAALATVLASQIVASRRMQGSLRTANTDLAGAQASLETNNRMLRAVQAELKRARRQLVDGIEGSSDGFALYDAEDRLVVCNSRYSELFGLHPNLLQPGTPYADILRAHVSAGRVTAAVGREDAWIAERLAQHRDPQGLFERNIDGHWFRFSDRPTSEGGTVTVFTQIDELKQREQRLHDSQVILQSILDHIPVTVSITDRERRIVLLNRRLEDIYGVHQAEVVGRPIDEVRPPRYRTDRAARDHFRVIETGEPILGRADDYGRGRDAESWITNVAPIKGEDGAVRYVLRTTFEVPQLAKANRELADYRAFLIDAERQAKIASWHQDPDGGYRTVWSENVEAVTGYTGAQIPDDAAFLGVVHPDDRDRVERLFRALHDHPESYDAEYRMVRRDGRTIWARGITKVVFDEAGNLVRYIGSIQDITESKRAEQALRDSEAILKEAQRRARLAYWLWDPDASRYVHAAEAAEILGLPVADLATNDDFLPYVHEDDRAWVAEAYLGQTERLEPCVIEYRWRRPDGKVIWLRDMCEQEHDSTGRVRRLVGTIQDVTEQKHSEEALRENQALLLAAQRRARIAYWLEDTGAGQAYITSDFMAEVLGLPADGVPTTDGEYLKIVHPEDRARVAHAYERAVAGNKPYALEYRIFRSDGSMGWMRELAEFQVGPAGKPTRLIGTIQDITEQKAIETALRDSEAHMRAFMDNAPIGMFVKDLDGRFTMLNRHDAEFFGCQPEDVIGRRSSDFLASDHAAIVEAHDRSVLLAGAPVERELHFANRPRIEWSYEVKFPIRDAGGTVVAMGGVAVDISAVKRAEGALRDSEARLRAFLDHAPAVMYLKDAQGHYQIVNRAFEALAEITAEAAHGRTIFEPKPHDSTALLAAQDREVLEQGAVVTREVSDTMRSIYQHMLVTKFPVRDGMGTIVGVGCFAQDITQQKRAEQSLRDSEARMRAFMDYAPMLIYLKDAEGRYQLVNREFERVEGVSDDQARGKTAFDIVSRERAERYAATDREVMAHGRMVARENHDPARPYYRDTLAVKFPVRDASGNVVGVGGFTQDITERKRAENALRESEARLRRAQLQAKLACWSWDLGTDSYVWAAGSGLALGRADADLPLANTDYSAFVHPEDRDGLWRLYAEVEAGRDAFTAEYRILRPDGDVIWVEEIGEVERDADGRRLSVSGTLQDITERKRAEAALRDSEARLRGFLDHAPFAMYLKDTDLRYLLVNRAVEQFQGMTAAEICGKTPAQIYPPWLAERFAGEDREVMERGVPVTFEYSDPAMDSFADSLTVRFPVRDSGGRIVAIGGITQDISERKQVERALRESEERLRSFMDNAPVAVAIKDLDRRFILVNNRIEQAYGRPTSEIIGRRTIELSASEGAKSVDALEQEVISTGNAATAEVCFAERSALSWTVEVKFPIRNANGEMVAIGGVAVDISDRKKVELALAESEARFRSFMDNAPFDMVVKDLKGRYLMVNRGVASAWHLTTAEILGRSLPDLSCSDGVAQVESIEREVVDSGHAVAREVHFADLGPEWTYEVKFPIRDAAGGIVALGGVAIDISDRKKAQMELAESEARLRRAQQQARLAYWSWQFATGRTPEEFRWSPGSGQLLGMADADMPKNDSESMDLTIPEDRARLRRLYNEARTSLDNYTVEYCVRRPDGVVVWVREIAEVVRDADGRRVGVEGTMQDITDQRALEEQLRQSQKMESIGQLTGGIAHDFNNLMAVILGNLELLAEDLPGNAAAQQKIDTAIRSTLRGSDLTQRLLAFARQQSLAPKLTQIDDLMQSMSDLLLRPLGPSIEATFALGGGLWPTEIDQAGLETSLLNLVINARDAMPDGGKLTIATSNVMIEPGDIRQSEGVAPGDYVLIAVSDSGEGMTEEVRARAFDPFFTTKGIGKGTGLGLSMVYGFVKQSGGHIELISEIGRGTTVNIYLPAAKGSVAVAGAPARRKVDPARGVREALDDRGGA